MTTENSPARFTLRQEYFGGFVYDAKTAKHELVNPDEYKFLNRLASAENAVFEQSVLANKELGQRISTFKKFGFIDAHEDGRLSLVSFRLVQPPSYIPDGMLTAPIRVFDTYTRRCNFSCDHCYFSSDAFVKEDRRTMYQTADILQKFYNAGSMEWRFTGGEALTQPDLFDAMAISKNLGMNVGLYTNGWWSEESAKKVFDAGLNEITISLEGRQEVNDRRRKSGSFSKAVETINRIAEYNRGNKDKKINGIIATAVGKDNVADVEFLIRLAATYGFNINFIPLKPSGRAVANLPEAMLTTREFMEFSRNVQKMREDPEIMASGIKIIHKYKDLFCPSYPDLSGKPFPFNFSECGALTTAVSLLPDGRVFACPFVFELDTAGEFIGQNLTEVSLQEAWHDPNFEKFRQAVKTDCTTGCNYYMRQCRGACRATVLGYGGQIKDGKLVGKDPYCYASLMPKS